MGAPRTNDRGLSFKEKLQLAIAESDNNDRMKMMPSTSSTFTTAEGSGSHGNLTSATIARPTGISAGKRKRVDAAERDFRWNSLVLLEKAAESILLQRENAESSLKETAALRSTLYAKDRELEAKDREIEEIRQKLEAKDQRDREKNEEILNLRRQIEALTTIQRQSLQRPQQNHQQVQVPSPLRPPELQPRPPVIHRKIHSFSSPLRSSSSSETLPSPYSPRPSVSCLNSSPISRKHFQSHSQTHNHHLRSDSPPRLSPAVTPRHSPVRSAHPPMNSPSDEDELEDLDLEAPSSSISKLPQKRSMSPYNTTTTSPYRNSIPGLSHDRHSSPDFRRSPNYSRIEVHSPCGSPPGHTNQKEQYKRNLSRDEHYKRHLSSSSSREEQKPDITGGHSVLQNGIVVNPLVKKDRVSSTSSGGESDPPSQFKSSSNIRRRFLSTTVRKCPSSHPSTKEKSQEPFGHFFKHNFLSSDNNINNKQTLQSISVSNNAKVDRASSSSPIGNEVEYNGPILTKRTRNVFEELETKVEKIVRKKEQRQTRPSLLNLNDQENCVTTKVHYFINDMEDRMNEMLRQQDADEAAGRFVEVPAWRKKKYEVIKDPSNYPEIEELSEAVFLKRHLRLEVDERRRKRWDSQRVREETYLERLKRRMEEREKLKIKRRRAAAGRRPGPGGYNDGKVDKESDEEVDRVHPVPDDILYIRVAEDMPISAFGNPMPILEKNVFDLPWVSKVKSPSASPLASPNSPSSSSISSSTTESPTTEDYSSSSSSSSSASLPSVPPPMSFDSDRSPSPLSSPSPELVNNCNLTNNQSPTGGNDNTITNNFLSPPSSSDSSVPEEKPHEVCNSFEKIIPNGAPSGGDFSIPPGLTISSGYNPLLYNNNAESSSNILNNNIDGGSHSCESENSEGQESELKTLLNR